MKPGWAWPEISADTIMQRSTQRSTRPQRCGHTHATLTQTESQLRSHTRARTRAHLPSRPRPHLALTWRGPHGRPHRAGHWLHQGHGLSGDLSRPKESAQGPLAPEAPRGPALLLSRPGPARPRPSPACQALLPGDSSDPAVSSGPPRGGRAASRTLSRRPSWWAGH